MSKPKRNDPCPCGSGKKYKQCCGAPKPPRKIKATVLSGKTHKINFFSHVKPLDKEVTSSKRWEEIKEKNKKNKKSS